MNATTRPMFDGLKTCDPRYLMTYLVSSDEPGDAREDPPVVRVPGLVGRRPDDAQDQRHAAAGEHRAGRPDERLRRRKVSATSITQQARIAARICGTLTWKWSPTWPSTWIVMITDATWRRGSRMLGRTSG